MDQRTIKKIKHLKQYMDEKSVAETLNIPEDLVSSVLRGNIEPTTIPSPTTSPYKIQVVEKARYVRNKTVCAISPGGGKGKTTLLTSLAVAAAVHNPNRRPIGLLDLSEFPKVISSLGLNYRESIIDAGGALSYLDNDSDFSSYAIPHPVLDNLYIIPGIPVADNYLQLDTDKMISIIQTLQHRFEITFIDLPAGFSKITQLLPYSDTVFIILTPDYGCIEGFMQLLPTLNRLDLINRSFIVLNRLGYPGFLDVNDLRKVLKTKMNDYYSIIDNDQIEFLGFLPEAQDILNQLNGRSDNIILGNSNSEFTREIMHILSKLCPDWQIKTEQSNGIAGALGRLFKRL